MGRFSKPSNHVGETNIRTPFEETKTYATLTLRAMLQGDITVHLMG